MSKDLLRQFLEQIMQVSAGRGHLGGATAGIAGTSQVNHDVRMMALEFAEVYTARQHDQGLLAEKASAVEGGINGLFVTGVISEKLCQELIDKLHALVDVS